MSREPDPTLTRRERRDLERRNRPLKDRSRVRGTRRSPKRPAWQSPFVLVSGLAILAVLAIIVLNQKSAPTGDGELFTPPISYAGDIVDGDVLGKADAPVLLEVWSDFQCPVCGRFVRDDFATLKTQLVDAGVLRIESHDLAFLGTGARNESLELATGAMCAADQDRYWPFHDFIFFNQGRENAGDYSEAYLASIATRVGLDKAAWDACMGGDEVRSAVQSETQVAQGLGVNATPTISLNGGNRVAGLPDLDQLIAQIQALGSPARSPTASVAP